MSQEGGIFSWLLSLFPWLWRNREAIHFLTTYLPYHSELSWWSLGSLQAIANTAANKQIIAPEMPMDSQTHMLMFIAWAPAALHIAVTKGLQWGPAYNMYNLDYIYPVLPIIRQLSETWAKWKSNADSTADRFLPRLSLDVSRSKWLFSRTIDKSLLIQHYPSRRLWQHSHIF